MDKYDFTAAAKEYDDELKSKYKTYLLCGMFFLFIFVAFFAVGIYLSVRQIQASRYAEIDAVVVDYKIIYEHDDSSFGYFEEANYYEVVEYEIDGQTYRKTCDTRAHNNKPEMGKVITIFVNQDNPKDVVFSNSTHIVLAVACTVVPVGGFVGVGFVLRKAYKTKKELEE